MNLFRMAQFGYGGDRLYDYPTTRFHAVRPHIRLERFRPRRSQNGRVIGSSLIDKETYRTARISQESHDPRLGRDRRNGRGNFPITQSSLRECVKPDDEELAWAQSRAKELGPSVSAHGPRRGRHKASLGCGGWEMGREQWISWEAAYFGSFREIRRLASR